MNHKISVRRQNLIQKFKKKNPIIIWLFWFRISLFFFKNCSSPQPNICVFFFHFFGNFSSNKKFHERKKLIRELKKEKKKKIKRGEEKKNYQSVYWCHSMQWIQFLETHLCINNRKKHFFFVALDSAIKDVQCVYFCRKKPVKRIGKK